MNSLPSQPKFQEWFSLALSKRTESDIPKAEIAQEVLPWLRVLKDGTIKRIAGIDVVPAGTDPQTGVVSKDIVIVPETSIRARLYRTENMGNGEKVPLVVYFHGGAFCIASVADPFYHNILNLLAAEAKVVIVSVDYRMVPEHPVPSAYKDAWSALQWVASHVGGNGPEEWLKNVDFNKVFLAGDSAGANIAHHTAMRVGSNPTQDLKLQGTVLIHPYFWGKDPIGIEKTDHERKALVDSWWKYTCPTNKGNDDPFINPFADGAPPISGLGCDRVLVCVAEKDILKDRGVYYYEKLVKSGWRGMAEMEETKGEEHVFQIFNPRCEAAKDLVKKWGIFINKKWLEDFL